MSEREIYLVRHGQTHWNRQQRIQGNLPIPLNKIGQRQMSIRAKDLVRRLAHVDVQNIGLWSSHLLRAKQSAAWIQKSLHLPAYQLHRGLREFDMGILEGALFQDLQKIPEWIHFLKHPEQAVFPQGESLNQAWQRAWQTWNDILQRDDHPVLILVSHGGPLRLMILKLLGLDLSAYHRLQIDNASLTVVKPWHGIWRLISINEGLGSYGLEQMPKPR